MQVHPSIDRGILGCLLTGYAKGGTSLLKDLMVQACGMQSGFEGGLLLVPGPAHGIPEPHARNLLQAWQPGDDFLDDYRRCATFEDGYRLLRDRAAVVTDRDAPLLDKTPQYMVCLPDVLRRAPGTPLVVVIRDPLHVLVSWVQLGNALDDSIAWVRSATESLLEVLARREAASGVYLVNLADVIRDADAALAGLGRWLGRSPRRIDHARKCGLPYVAGGRRRRGGIEADRHDMATRCTPFELARIRRDLLRAIPDAEWLATVRSGPAVAGRPRTRAA